MRNQPAHAFGSDLVYHSSGAALVPPPTLHSPLRWAGGPTKRPSRPPLLGRSGRGGGELLPRPIRGRESECHPNIGVGRSQSAPCPPPRPAEPMVGSGYML